VALFYEDVLRALQDGGVRYVLVGGTAVVLHGVPRTTADPDIVIDLEPSNVRRLIEVVMGLGFRPRPPVSAEALADSEQRRERTRFRSTCWSCTRSPRTAGSPGAGSSRIATWRTTASLATSRATSAISSLRSSTASLEDTPPQQTPQPADHSGRALVVLDDVLEDRPHLLTVRPLRPQDPLGRLGVAQDRGEGLAELVRQGRGELPHRRDPGDVVQVPPEPPHLHVSPPAGEDAGEHLPEEPEALDHVVVPHALAAQRAEGQGSHHHTLHHEGDLDPGRDAQPSIQ
jgi:hypothetical protein